MEYIIKSNSIIIVMGIIIVIINFEVFEWFEYLFDIILCKLPRYIRFKQQ